MNDQPLDTASHKAQSARRTAERAARRKAELMANMARRKAQLRARGDAGQSGQAQGDDAQSRGAEDE
jgi:hypothetical protein